VTPLFKKLNLAEIDTIHVLDAPASFEAELEALRGVTVHRTAKGTVQFALAFVTTLDQVAKATDALTRAADGDAVLWMVYPKASSKRIRCEFTRDTGWQALGAAGYEPVSQVAIDEDWSALRFRKAEYIKTMRRNPDGAISATGRKKALAAKKMAKGEP
jgi:hypothetical protein